MRLSAFRIDDGANTLGCLPLQRMPASIRPRLRHVHAGKENSLTMTGLTKQVTRIADSGNEVMGVFCPECGVRIYHVLKSAQDVRSLKPGTLDAKSWLRPGYFIWMKESARLGSCPQRRQSA